VATALLVLGLLSLLATLAALLYVRPLGWLMPLYFLVSWLQGELAGWHLAWQGLLAAGLVAGGALEETRGQWGLVLLLASFVGLGYILLQSRRAETAFRGALVAALGDNYRDAVPLARRGGLGDGVDWHNLVKPFAMRRPGVRRVADVAYGDAGERNLLDIYAPETVPPGGCPVLIHVHGGAWMIGKKQQQGQPLMNYLVPRGWVCVDINYRLSPKHRFPAHIIDVKRAIAWVRGNIGNYGGNPDFIALTGGSAGGHLTALAALTPGLAEFQPGFEQEDTSVDAAVPFYGVFDWNGGIGPGDEQFRGFIATNVLHEGEDARTSPWLTRASPITHVHADAPPMLFVHGTHDALARVEDARLMVRALAAVATAPVAYAEVPGAQHAFDIFHSIRCDLSNQAVGEFLEWAYATREARRSAR